MADDAVDLESNGEADLPIEDFIAQGNARERGEEPPEPVAEAQPAAAKEAAAPDKADTKPPSPGSRKGRLGSIQSQIDALTTTKHKTQKEVEETQAELTRLRGDLERERAAAKAPAAAAPPPRPATPPPPPPMLRLPNDPEPTLEQFAKEADPYTAYARSMARWEARQEHARIQMSQHAQSMYATRTSKLTEKLASYEASHPGFSAALHPEVAGVKFTTPRELGSTLGDLIVDSPHTAALLDHFSRNYPDFQRISALHPILVARELGKLESRFDAASSGPAVKPPPISHAKAPNKPVGGSPVVSDDAEDDEASLPIEEFVRRGNKRDARQSSARR